LAIAYYRWGEEMRETSGGRVHISGPVPLNDITRAVETIKIGYEKYGVRCFWARPNPFNHRTLGSHYYDPMYEILTDLNCAFATHEFMGLNGTSAGSERFRSFTEWHTVVHPMEQQMAMLSMMVHGVFERHPKLRVGYMEGNCSWLPWWLWRMEEQLELAGEKEMPECRKSPTEYFKNNCWITTEPDEPGVYHVIDEMGDNKILWESDYPHPDSKYPYSSEHFLDMPKVSDESKRKILWQNALDFYQFPESYLPTEFKEATATNKAAV
jgi:predicted TIM-barrel fold metal-dependent hydrolase